MTLHLITYLDHQGMPRAEWATTAGGAFLRAEELEAEGYTEVSADPQAWSWMG